jgi:hypothetical protein
MPKTPGTSSIADEEKEKDDTDAGEGRDLLRHQRCGLV